jgi:hypothetical protein
MEIKAEGRGSDDFAEEVERYGVKIRWNSWKKRKESHV